MYCIAIPVINLNLLDEHFITGDNHTIFTILLLEIKGCYLDIHNLYESYLS